MSASFQSEQTKNGTALSRVIQIWKPNYGRLITGGIIAELAVCSGLLLMGQAGSRVAAAAVGVAAGSMLLQIAGSSQIVLRYFERLYTHDAMFRALSDLRVWFYRRLAGGAAAGLGFQRSGDLLSRLVSDVQTLDNLYLRILIPLAAAVLTLPVATVVWLKAGLLPGLITGGFFCHSGIRPALDRRTPVQKIRPRHSSCRCGPPGSSSRSRLRLTGSKSFWR
ncbi:ABC-type transport system [Gluconobacter frateurii NBRC 103465]|nr:ABC-type transport system [Gluconobacter frateurii NBRC 103465]